MKGVVEGIIVGVVAIWVAFTSAFVLLRLVPANALMTRISQSELKPDEAAQLIASYGLDQSVAQQYLSQIVSYLRGDLGRSLRTGQPVSLVLQRRLWNTLELTLTVGGVAIGSTLGLVFLGWHSAAVRRAISTLSAVSLSLPIYWTGMLMLFTVGAWLRLPQSAFALPLLTLAFHLTAQLSHVGVSTLQHVTRQPFVAFGRSKGLHKRALWWRYILRPASPVLLTMIGTQLIVLMGSTITVEMLFSRPGLGSTLVDAVIARDYPVVQGVVVVLAIFSVIINVTFNGMIRLIDPRMRAL